MPNMNGNRRQGERANKRFGNGRYGQNQANPNEGMRSNDLEEYAEELDALTQERARSGSRTRQDSDRKQSCE